MQFQNDDFSIDELIFREDERGDCAYVIQSGRVEIFIERDGKDISIATLNEGEIFGEMAIISASNRSASARALEDCQLQRIEAQQFHRRMSNMDPIMRMITEVLLTRLHSMLQRIRNPGELPDVEFSGLGDPSEAIDKLKLESQIAGAISSDQFKFYYQPIIRMATGKIAGFEALIRWVHPERGIMSPDTFIPIAEQSDLIQDITALCLRHACSDLADLRCAALSNVNNIEPLFMSINMSARDLDNPDFPTSVKQNLKRFAVSGSDIKLELTEGALMQNVDQACVVLDELRNCGIGIAIDDFGTGYSSMSHLARLPISIMKIDRSFVASMELCSQNRKIVTSTLRLAEELGCSTVAEGIETAEDAAFLAKNNCKFGQGYYFARPMPLNCAVRMIRSWSSPKLTGPLSEKEMQKTG